MARTIPRGLDPNIAWLLWDAAEAHAGTVALRDGERSVTYSDLRARAAAYAHALRDAGLRSDDRVVVFLEHGADVAAAYFGVAAAGGIAIIANEALRSRQLEHIVTHAGARFLVTSDTLMSLQARDLQVPVTRIGAAAIAAGDDRFAPVARLGRDMVQMIYTSGSTGMPKGVCVSHANLWAGMRSVTHYLELRSDDRILGLLPFSFVYGFNQLLCATGVGATVVIERSPFPQDIVATLRRESITSLPAVPPVWLQLLQVEDFRERPVASLRSMTNAGGRLPPTAALELRRTQPHARLYLMYGQTETFRGTYLDPEQVDRHPDSMGRAVPGAEVLLIDEDGLECGIGEVGEIVHRGPTVALGYWNDPEATDATFRPHPLRPAGIPATERVVFSGDLARRDEDGLLYFVGRRDRMIKTLGYRVGPDEVLDVLYSSGQIREAAIVPEQDELRGTRIIAVVVLAADGSLDALKKYCRAELPRYMQPTRYDLVDALPRTGSGKHDVKALLSA